MGKIWMLAKANIKENKGQSVSLVVLVFIAALLLNLGLLVSLNFTSAFDKIAVAQNSPQVSVLMIEHIYKDEYQSYLNAYPGVVETEREEVTLLPSASFKYENGSQTKGALIMNASNSREVMKVSYIGDTLPADENSIYVPYLLKTGGGYALGDDFTLTYAGRDYIFQIAGFTEDVSFSTINSSIISFYLTDAAYRRFGENPGDGAMKAVLLNVVLDGEADPAHLISDFKATQISPEDYRYTATSDIDTTRSARTISANISAMIIVAVAIVILLVNVIVIRFRIANSIEDGMANIGALKACGYTSRQMIGYIATQVSVLSIVGAVLGIGVSYLAVPLISDSFSVQTGFIWEQGVDTAISLMGLCAVLLVVLLVSWLSARRVNHLHPIIALRGGLKTHSFRKNRFALDSTGGNLHLLVSLKRLAQSGGQHASIALIVAAVCFVAVFGLIMYNNFVLSNGAFKIISGELPDVMVVMNENTDNSGLLDDIADMDGVRKAIYYDYSDCTIEYHNVLCYVTEDFSQTESEMLYEGRHPKHENEVALNGFLAKFLGKSIGDSVDVTIGSAKEPYLITGLFQTSNYLGMDLEMTYDGLTRLRPEYRWLGMNVYLDDGTDTGAFIDGLQGKNDPRISSLNDMEEYIGTFASSYASIVRILVIVLMGIILLVITLILYLVIKTMILREKRSFGIQKAVGFTTMQLMCQIALTFLPVVLIGVATGCIAGYFGTNPVLSMLFGGIGIMKVSFSIAPLWVVVFSVCVVLFAYAVSMLVAWRIRKISAYALISE